MSVPARFHLSTPPGPVGDLVPSALLRDLSTAASGEERGTTAIAASIDLLRRAGYLTDTGAAAPARTARILMRIAAANLSVARLYEGHINALRLIELYGTAGQNSDLRRYLAGGALLGVWGADSGVPVVRESTGGGLGGAKIFASGLGTVSHAIITVESGPQVRLALVDVSDMDRADPTCWDMRGMRATASGRYDFQDMPPEAIDWIGAPGDYLTEPHFVGGIWRIAAVQVGAATGLLDRAATELRMKGRMQAEAQKARLMDTLTRAWAGIALVERAAEASVRVDLASEQIVVCAIAARLFTEEVGLTAITAAEQSLGLAHFAAGSDTDRMARDLSVYLRQAARDAMLQRAADTALVRDGDIWGVSP